MEPEYPRPHLPRGSRGFALFRDNSIGVYGPRPADIAEHGIRLPTHGMRGRRMGHYPPAPGHAIRYGQENGGLMEPRVYGSGPLGGPPLRNDRYPQWGPGARW
jgi:hypothetical protein